jgi:hypothetical protein
MGQRYSGIFFRYGYRRVVTYWMIVRILKYWAINTKTAVMTLRRRFGFQSSRKGIR